MGIYKKELVLETAKALTSYGYQVYLAGSKEYGFYTDGISVVSFGGSWEFSLDFGGKYGPASQQSGTGWQIASEKGVLDECEARGYITALIPAWASRGQKLTKTTPEQHLKTYGKSSQYTLFAGE